MVTPVLFKHKPDAETMAAASVDEIFSYMRSISYPNNKAKHLKGMAQLLVEKFNCEVPATVEELQTLPGVGRKTANVITSVVFNQPSMAVDTHVFRVSARLGLTTNAKNPLQTEQQLMKFIPTL
jgi:endonuclease-3